MSKQLIEEYLVKALHPTLIAVIDDSAKHIGHAGAREGGHYNVYIVSEVFAGKTLLERHRLVYAAIAPIKNTIHALAIKAKTPTEI